jgi:hypothetical protein
VYSYNRYIVDDSANTIILSLCGVASSLGKYENRSCSPLVWAMLGFLQQALLLFLVHK